DIADRHDDLSGLVDDLATTTTAIGNQKEALAESIGRLPDFQRRANTTFVNLRAALDDLDPLVETAKPATRNLAPFLAELRPVLSKAVPVFRDLRLSNSRPGFANDTAETLGFLPAVQERASRAFPHAEQAIEDFLPSLRMWRAYTPDFFNGFGKLGQITAAYDGNGHYARGQLVLNLFKRNASSGELEPIAPSEQYDSFGGSAGVRRPCPGGGTQSAPDGSNPFTEPPFAGSGVNPSSDCDPADAPPGP
ncbi:MAG TPA: hypothetical protein VFM94_05210, partial [Solirubrobacterales bacterium]|nr:hypothetical protein [Solirubrobacterales bacterium]